MMMQSTNLPFPRLVSIGAAILVAALAIIASLGAPGSAFACSWAASPTPMGVLQTSGVAVIAEVASVSDTEVVLHPQAFMKGPANAEDIVFRREANLINTCEAGFAGGQRVLLFIPATGNSWPLADSVFELEDGIASWQGARVGTESQVISEIRSFTGQYAVPAANEEEGATLDWKKVVLPVGLATLAVFAVSLVLMRVWHRIDPS